MTEPPTLRGTWNLAREAAALALSGKPTRAPRWVRTAVAIISIGICPPLDWATKPELLRRLLWGTPIPPRKPAEVRSLDDQLSEDERELDRRRAVLAERDRRRVKAERDDAYQRQRDATRSDWPPPQVVHDKPLRAEPYRPEGET